MQTPPPKTRSNTFIESVAGPVKSLLREASFSFTSRNLLTSQQHPPDSDISSEGHSKSTPTCSTVPCLCIHTDTVQKQMHIWLDRYIHICRHKPCHTHTHTHTHTNDTNLAFLKGPCATRTMVLPYRMPVWNITSFPEPRPCGFVINRFSSCYTRRKHA